MDDSGISTVQRQTLVHIQLAMSLDAGHATNGSVLAFRHAIVREGLWPSASSSNYNCMGRVQFKPAVDRIHLRVPRLLGDDATAKKGRRIESGGVMW